MRRVWNARVVLAHLGLAAHASKYAEVVMKIMKTRRLCECLVAASMSLIACASRESSEPPLTPASGGLESSAEVPAAADENSATDENEGSEPSEARKCVSTDDCGEGYVCGFDPERSHVERYCLAE
jgi:hypothetical protein